MKEFKVEDLSDLAIAQVKDCLRDLIDEQVDADAWEAWNDRADANEIIENAVLDERIDSCLEYRLFIKSRDLVAQIGAWYREVEE